MKGGRRMKPPVLGCSPGALATGMDRRGGTGGNRRLHRLGLLLPILLTAGATPATARLPLPPSVTGYAAASPQAAAITSAPPGAQMLILGYSLGTSGTVAFNGTPAPPPTPASPPATARPAGTWSVISAPQKPGGVIGTTALAADTAGNLYVADFNRIQRRDAQGNWALLASAGGQIGNPTALAVGCGGQPLCRR